MQVSLKGFFSVIGALLLMVTSASAESGAWRITEMSGTVRTSQPMAGVQLVSTGQTFDSGAVLSTGVDGRAVLTRGEQRIVVGPNSRMSLPAAEEQGMTRILQDVGTLLFKVDKKDKQHFRVETPVIAAVVKGTTFTVTAGADGHAVHVAEGIVEVSSIDGNARELVTAGLTARVSRDNPSVIVMSNNESGDSTRNDGNAIDTTPDSDDARTDDEVSDKQRHVNLIVPAEIGTESLDFSALTDGLVEASENRPHAATNAAFNDGSALGLRGNSANALANANANASFNGGNANANIGNNGNGNGGVGLGVGNGNSNGNGGVGVDVGVGNENGGVGVDVGVGNENGGVGVDVGADVGGDSGIGVDVGVDLGGDEGGGLGVDIDLGLGGLNLGL